MFNINNLPNNKYTYRIKLLGNATSLLGLFSNPINYPTATIGNIIRPVSSYSCPFYLTSINGSITKSKNNIINISYKYPIWWNTNGNYMLSNPITKNSPYDILTSFNDINNQSIKINGTIENIDNPLIIKTDYKNIDKIHNIYNLKIWFCPKKNKTE